MGHSC